jgi:UDP-N-acetylmuramoyl-tripeptide--D-alanyl-D-alanine ligase
MSWRYTVNELASTVGAETPGSDHAFARVSTDTRTLERGDVFFALAGENFDGTAFTAQALEAGAAAVVTTKPHPGGPCIVVEDPLAALQCFAGFHRSRYAIPVIAITGSCGKTTSKDLIAAVLKSKYKVAQTEGNLNNEIGCPLSLLGMDSSTERAVMEMGANHVGEIAALCALAKPTESAITMIGAAHLEGFGSIEAVAKAKAEIAESLPLEGTFYVNADDPRCVEIGKAYAGPTVAFGKDGDVRLEACSRLESGEMLLRIEPGGEFVLPLPSAAHASNVLLAVAVGLQHGIEEFETVLREACLSSRRFQVVRVGPLEILDDSYNSNPVSARVAIDALAERPTPGKRIALLGDMLELGTDAGAFHAELGRYAAERGISHVFARGDHAHATIEAARGGGAAVAEALDGYDELAQAIADVAAEGDTLLVKGSRGMAMEKVIKLLRDRYSDPGVT